MVQFLTVLSSERGTQADDRKHEAPRARRCKRHRQSQAGSGEDRRRRALNDNVRALMRELQEELIELDAGIAGQDRKIRELCRHSEICQRLGKVEGIGPVTETALVAAVGDRSSFRNGRQFAAWLGLVPKQRSGGGRARLLGTSKRANRYLRTLLIHRARSALGGFEISRIQEACGWVECGSGDTPTLSLSRSPTRMHGSPGASHQRQRL
jgi:transposase